MVSVNDIFNRPPAISEDTLQYTLYLPPGQSDRISATSLSALLADHVNSLLPDHLWHRDAFELKVATDPEGEDDVWILEGRMRVGDCIDDEWCAVWLLRELSRKFDLVISVFDSDGEFLLIEAADELPSWVTPTNAENRVWIHNSHLHLVSLSHISPPSSKNRRRTYITVRDSDDEENINQPGEESQFITATDAVKLVRDPLVETSAPPSVQEVVWTRISGYPAASRQHMHVTNAYLPADIAKALAVNPLLVQKAVETFYTRDALQLRAAQKMNRFSPEPSVLSSVKMTRTAYAQLLGQKFHPPKVFGRWTEREGTKEWKWRDVGMKIACGFEMLYQEQKNRKETVTANYDGSSASMEALKDTLRRNSDYAQYIQHLGTAGFFKGELEGSQLWVKLENQAATAFVAARRDDDASRPSFATAVQTAINQYTDDRRLHTEEEDDDDWLNVDASDFDAMLEKTVRSAKGKQKATDAMDVDQSGDDEDEEDRVAKAQAARLRDLAQKVEEFVEGQGDVEGARFADEAFSDDDDEESVDGDIIDDSNDESSEDSDDVHMDGPDLLPASPLSEEQRASRQAAMDRLVPPLDPAEYGMMPPMFHSNSQRVAPVTVETEVRDEQPSWVGNAGSSGSGRVRPPIISRNQYDGVDSDDETDEEDVADDDEDEDDHPQILGEVEIDMAEEQDEFIEFARQALGVSDEQWRQILNERNQRGVFVPPTGTKYDPASPKSLASSPTKITNAHQDVAKQDLGSFEDVMRALDAELVRSRHEHTVSQMAHTGTMPVRRDEPLDIEAAMEAEFESLLHRDDDDDNTAEGSGVEEAVDYQLIRNFLESFKSEAGTSGPVSALVGRLQQGWTLPRDERS